MRTHILLALATLAGTAAGQPTLITDARLVDPGRGIVIDNTDIRFDNGTIIEVGIDLDADGAEIIDAEGRYAMPGLIDSHIHFSASPQTYGPLMLAHGIVLARDMGADTELITTFRDQIAEGLMIAPDLLVTGAIIDGNPPVWPFSEPVETPYEARAAVRKLHEAGVDQIKLYSKLDPASYLAACDEATKLGLMPVGHVPADVSLWEAAEAGHRMVEHLTGVPDAIEIEGRSRDERSLMERVINPWPRLAGATPEAINAMAERAAETGIVHCPTLVVYDGIIRAGNPDEDDERMRFVSESMRQFWSIPGYAEGAAVVAEYRTTMTDVVAAMHDAGVIIIAGTDLANPYIFAGSSLHDELVNLSSAGMTNAEALRAATQTPAEVFGVSDRFGAIKPGADASFVLLAASPLDDLANLSTIDAVVHRGTYLDRAALDAMIDEAAEIASSATAANARAIDSAELWAEKGIVIEGEVVTTGTYALEWGEFEAGTETFTLTRTDDGLNLYAHFNPSGGMQPPALTVYELTPDRELRAARHVPLRNAAYDARYSYAADTISAVNADETQSLPRSAEMIPSGPNTAVDFFVLHRLGLGVGEKREGEFASFGFPGWQFNATPVVIERVSESEYRYVMNVPFGEMTGTVTLGDDGFPAESTLEMPFGTLRAVRE
jgi:imidazolonepropionase-like amidohydrolase